MAGRVVKHDSLTFWSTTTAARYRASMWARSASCRGRQGGKAVAVGGAGSSSQVQGLNVGMLHIQQACMGGRQ